MTNILLSFLNDLQCSWKPIRKCTLTTDEEPIQDPLYSIFKDIEKTQTNKIKLSILTMASDMLENSLKPPYSQYPTWSRNPKIQCNNLFHCPNINSLSSLVCKLHSETSLHLVKKSKHVSTKQKASNYYTLKILLSIHQTLKGSQEGGKEKRKKKEKSKNTSLI